MLHIHLLCSILLFLVGIGSIAASCVAYSGQRLTSICSDVVDYNYYLPTGYTQAAIDTAVLSTLSNKNLYILPPKCQIALKKLVCANAFYKCNTGSFTNPSFPLPFQRPCQHVCEDANDECYGVLSLLGFTNNCAATKAFTGTFTTSQYDSSNNATICNMMNVTTSVASTKETYLFQSTGVCAGITKSLYVPSANLVSSSLAPFQSPYVVQNIIETSLSQALSALPVWLSEECHFALRKYFCGSYFLHPQKQSFANVPIANFALILQNVLGSTNGQKLYNYEFYLPSYPSQEVCTEYESQCAAFIESAGLASLVPNCSAVSSGILKYPSDNQTIASVSLLGQTIKFDTMPNKMESAHDNGYETVCPGTFVVPEDKTDGDITWITGTGCAMPCRLPIWTLDEWKSLDLAAVIIPIIGLPLITALATAWIFDKNKRKQYLIICFSVTSFFATLIFVAMAAKRGNEGEKVFCRSNAVPLNFKDGFSLCAFQAVTLNFTALGCCISWLMQTIDLFLRIVLQIQTTNMQSVFWVYLSLIFGLPTISTLYMIVNRNYGYGSLLPWCYMSAKSPKDIDIPTFYMPILIVTCIGVLIMTVVIFYIFKTISKANRLTNKSKVAAANRDNESSISSRGIDQSEDTESNSSKKITGDAGSTSSKRYFTTSTNSSGPPSTSSMTKSQSVRGVGANKSSLIVLKTPIIFVITFLIVWITLFSYRGRSYIRGDEIKKSFKEWIACVFTNYQQLGDDYVATCGEHSENRINVGFALWVIICASGQSILVSSVFLPQATLPSDFKWILNKYLPDNVKQTLHTMIGLELKPNNNYNNNNTTINYNTNMNRQKSSRVNEDISHRSNNVSSVDNSYHKADNSNNNSVHMSTSNSNSNVIATSIGSSPTAKTLTATQTMEGVQDDIPTETLDEDIKAGGYGGMAGKGAAWSG